MARGQLLPYGSGRQSADPLFMLQRQVEQLFDYAMRGPASQGTATMVVAPRMDISEDDKEIRVVAEMPGATPERIEVAIDDDMLTIRGERESERETKRRDYHLIERAVGVFQRSIRLPAPADASQVQARFEDGVLTLTIPKTSVKTRSRRVQVSSGNGSGEAASAGQSGVTAASGSDKESSEKARSASDSSRSSPAGNRASGSGKNTAGGKSGAGDSGNKGAAQR